jgi:hypothetical protein
MTAPSIKMAVFMDKVAELMVLSMKRDVFMDERIAQKRDTLPSMTWPCFVDKNGKTTNLSTNSPDFMDRCVILLCVSTKTGVFMDIYERY